MIRWRHAHFIKWHRCWCGIGLAFVVLLAIAPQMAVSDPKPIAFGSLIEAAWERTTHQVTYDGRYRKLRYPLGDPPDNIGVCSDVIVRVYRKIGFDLQKAVHEDMRRAFHRYPANWGLTRPDRNIDHRRVPNLKVYLKRQGAALPISRLARDYKPGNLVTWNLRGKVGSLPHIGIVSDRMSADGKRPLIIHNIGAGPLAEDILFRYTITGHYRFLPKKRNI